MIDYQFTPLPSGIARILVEGDDKNELFLKQAKDLGFNLNELKKCCGKPLVTSEASEENDNTRDVQFNYNIGYNDITLPKKVSFEEGTNDKYKLTFALIKLADDLDHSGENVQCNLSTKKFE